LFDPDTAFMGNSWLCQDTLDPLINYGYMEEVLVIGVYNTNARMSEYTYSFDKSVGDGGDGDKYLDFLEQELMPAL
jgi:predicted alpha/beta superfamily hydrolase